MEQGTKRGLPLLRLQDSFCIWLSAIKPQKIVLTYRSALWPWRKLQFGVVGYEISSVDESDFGIKVGLNLMLTKLMNKAQNLMSLRLKLVKISNNLVRIQ